MKPSNLLIILLLISAAAASITTTTGCANIIPPSGGPKDTLAPVLVSARPVDSARNFTGDKIVLTFDEYVQTLDNTTENVIFSPTPKREPIYESHLKTVTIRIKDTLQPNTTYSISFGNAIKDVNENNVLKNFSYVFSTGPAIDSLTLSGKVIVAETGKVDSTLIVGLYTNMDDSAVVKEKPRYITRVNREGSFTFHNLPQATFAIFAMKDEGSSKKYTSRTQLFGFSDSTVTSGVASTPTTLYVFVAKEDKQPLKSSIASAVPKPQGGKNAAADRRLRLSSNLTGTDLDLLSNFELSFSTAPYKYFDSTKVQFTTDKLEPIKGYHYERDTSNKKITLVYNWKPDTHYKLILDSTFAEDTLGHKLLRTDTIEIHTKKESEYAEVRLRFTNLDLSKNPVLQFVQSDKVMKSHVFTSKEFYAKLFVPGEYELRILFDENKNGIWDTGEYFTHPRVQPEKVIPVSRKINVKMNWENEIDITL
ncbi:MAG: Ig-like domain-containing protein [Chitinophagaceae bacterium]